MKATDNFKKVIQDHLNERAVTSPLFSETLKKENKNIDDCVTYILNTVKASGVNGYTDEEVFGMAAHYYDEDDVKPGSKIEGRVVVNHEVKLTAEEIAKAKQDAIDKVHQEQRDKMFKKPVATKPKAKPEPKLELPKEDEGSELMLF